MFRRTRGRLPYVAVPLPVGVTVDGRAGGGQRWGLILAGGEGAFWSVPGAETSLERARRRTAGSGTAVVARLPALLAMIRQVAPSLVAAFGPACAAIGQTAQRARAREVYAGLTPSSFTADVLAMRPSNLAVLRVGDARRSHGDRPERVTPTLPGYRDERADPVAAAV